MEPKGHPDTQDGYMVRVGRSGVQADSMALMDHYWSSSYPLPHLRGRLLSEFREQIIIR